jgi:hypothetical protein
MRRIQMTLDSGNSSLAYIRSLNKAKVSLPQQKVGMTLNAPMIGRIKNTPAGCGGCGK